MRERGHAGIAACLVFATLLASSACSQDAAPAPDRSGARAEADVATTEASGEDALAAAEVVDLDRLHVLMINGGGRPAINYQSHVLHLEQLLSVLEQVGLPAQRITIFSSDGEDPGEDLAVRQPAEHPQFWRVQGTPLQGGLRPLRYVSTSIDGFELQPATKEALREWFEKRRADLAPGDTLLVYVTDHGEKNDDDIQDNTITLWGEDLSVSQMREMVALLDPGVRVVTLMSQCFSGAFYYLADAHDAESALPSGAICGYFSSTADRPAYGCYPESRGRHNVGHSFRFFRGLADGGGSFVDAHERTLVEDATPDVPLRSSDMFLHDELEAAAHAFGVPLRSLADQYLERAWADRGRWEPQIRLLDRIGEAFGFFSPRSLEELEAQRSELPAISQHLRNVSRAWRAALMDANRAHYLRFINADGEWDKRLQPSVLRELDDDALRELTEEVLEAIAAFTERETEIEARLRELHERGRDAAASSFRMETRLAAVLRMRMILIQIAGRIFLEEDGSDEQRAAFAALRECEDLRLPAPIEVAELADAEPFPSLNEDIDRANAALPAWLGIRFRPAEPETRARLDLKPGASRVLTVFPESPAATAGLEVGDVLLGPPGEPFAEEREVRAWTMLAEIGTPRRLELLRADERRTVEIVPGAYPMQWPRLPGPPSRGETPPPLRLALYRGDAAALESRSHVLFFWATWCAPCKAAVPALVEFAAARGIPVIAVGDEPAEQLDAYFEKNEPFGAAIAIDEFRQTFQAYGVSGTPTFVWIEDGEVRAVSSGYSAAKGIGLDADPEAVAEP